MVMCVITVVYEDKAGRKEGDIFMLKQIKYFQSVVRNNSFSQAAEENFISQSAMSQQIQALERELGFTLLERRNRTFTLTPAGEYFYQKSLVLTADYKRMCTEAARIAEGGQASLKIGYLRCYTGNELHQALEQFAERYPDVDVSIEYGNHEELYDLLRTDQVDMVLNDQRRAFSEEYVNLILTTVCSRIEISSRNSLAHKEQITPQELKNLPCILVSSQAQQETEQEYYKTIVGFQGEFLYAENLEEARMMVIGRKGFMPVEGNGNAAFVGGSVTRIPLVREKGPILRNYCAFWKKENSGFYVESFAEILQAQFSE